MTRIFMLIAAAVLLTSSQASAQYYRGQLQGNSYIYPDGTIGYYYGLNAYRSGYYYIPPVNSGYYGPSSYNGGPLYGNRANQQGYYVPPNGSGGGGYYSNVPAYNGGTYYGR